MKKRILSIVLCVVMCISCVSVSAEMDGELAQKYLNGIINTIVSAYKYGVEKDEIYKKVAEELVKEHPELLEEAFEAATEVLDDYSVYFDKSELSSFITDVHQSYVGIGATVQKSENGCLIVEVNKNGGAREAGIMPGDEFVTVNDIDLRDKTLDEIIAMIKGEPDTVATIGLLRGETYFSLDVVRKKITMETVSHEIMGDVGYIKIDSFAQATADEVKAALYDIEEVAGLNKIIVDVRDNPGGELSSVIDVLEQFVPEEKILVKFEYKNEKYNSQIRSKAPFSYAPRRKIVVLVNENSASASELFSACLKSHRIAKIVGRTTFGKGSMQEMMGIKNPAGANLGDIKLTVAEFLAPDGSKINRVGVEPDFYVSNKSKDFDESALTPMTINARYTIGDEASDVLAIEERLYALGYSVGEVDGVYDKLTFQATKNFQAEMELFPYGVMDYTTQSVLNDAIEDLTEEIDTQLEEALKLLK